jgi:hypothetical protein
VGDAWVWWTDHEVWLEHTAEDARVVHQTAAFITSLVTDGVHVAWEEEAERYASETCDHWLMTRGGEPTALPRARAVHTGECGLLEMGGGRLLVADAGGALVLDAESGVSQRIPLFGRYSSVLYLVRDELLVLSGSLYRVELQ